MAGLVRDIFVHLSHDKQKQILIQDLLFDLTLRE